MAYYTWSMAERLYSVYAYEDKCLEKAGRMAENTCRQKGFHADPFLSGYALCMAVHWFVAWRGVEVCSWDGDVVLELHYVWKDFSAVFCENDSCMRDSYR